MFANFLNKIIRGLSTKGKKIREGDLAGKENVH